MLFLPGFIVGFLIIPVLLLFARLFGLYTCVNECEAQVFTLFGKVIGTLDEAGLQFPVSHFAQHRLFGHVEVERREGNVSVLQSAEIGFVLGMLRRRIAGRPVVGAAFGILPFDEMLAVSGNPHR